MIKGLKGKFIATNMLLVSLVLAVVFAVQVFTTYQRTQEMVERAQQRVEEWNRKEGPDRRPGREPPPDGMPFPDSAEVTASMWGQVWVTLAITVGALGAFYVISRYLAGRTVEPVERAWEQQRQFVADASHELKTPITVILTNSNILLSHPQDTVAEQKKWVEYTRDEARRMGELVDDMLFLAKTDAQREERPLVPVDLAETVWSAFLPLEPVAFEAGVALDSAVADGLTVRGRADQLRRLVTILLDNAVKYAGEGGKVRLTLESEGRTALLTVHNTGEPIPPEHLPHLFERFYRADTSRARSTGGCGLGLSIAYAIAQGHGGALTVESGQPGTSFTLRLPLAEG